MNFSAIARDVQLQIFSELTDQDLINSASVSKEWRDLANADCLWKSLALSLVNETSRLNTPSMDISQLACKKHLNNACPSWKGIYCRIYGWNRGHPPIEKKTREELIARLSLAQALGLYGPKENNPTQIMDEFMQTELFHSLKRPIPSPWRAIFNPVISSSPDLQFACFEIFIALGINIFESVGVDYMSALHWAAHAAHLQAIQLLLKRGVEINSRKHYYEQTPLFEIIKPRPNEERMAVVKFLIDKGARISVQSKVGHTLLHEAAKQHAIKMVELFFSYKISPDMRNNEGETPLHVAAQVNSVEIINYLIEQGAELDALDALGMTPLQHAINQGAVEAALRLIDLGACVNTIDKHRKTPLYRAIEQGELGLPIFSRLIGEGVSIIEELNTGISLLRAACIGGNEELVESLIKQGATIVSRNELG